MHAVQASKPTLSLDAWEQKLSQVSVHKEDMNKLVMNFLVTEARWAHGWRVVPLPMASLAHLRSGSWWHQRQTSPACDALLWLRALPPKP
jgi:hypothetical protein